MLYFKNTHTMKNLILILTNLFFLTSIAQLSLPLSIEMKEKTHDSFEITIRDSTDAHSSEEPYFCSTIKLSIKEDSLIYLDFSHRYFGNVIAVPKGDSIINPTFNFTIVDNKINLILFFKTLQYGSKFYQIQGELKVINNKMILYKPKGINIIKNDKKEFIYFFEEKNNFVIITHEFNDKKYGPNVFRKLDEF